MFKLSTGLRNGLLTTSSLKGLLDTGKIKIYAGTVPASANDALGSATLLCTISNNGTATGLTLASAAADGVLTKTLAEVWSGTNAAGGTATFFRWEMTGDDGSASTTAIRLQGTVGVAGADMNLSSVSLTSGAPQTLDYFTVAMPASA